MEASDKRNFVIKSLKQNSRERGGGKNWTGEMRSSRSGIKSIEGTEGVRKKAKHERERREREYDRRFQLLSPILLLARVRCGA